MRWFPARRRHPAPDPGTGPALSIHDDGRSTVVTMHVPLDSSTASGLQDVLRALAAGQPDRVIQLDLRGAAHCSTGGLLVVARGLTQGVHLIVEECSWADEPDHTGTVTLAAGGRS